MQINDNLGHSNNVIWSVGHSNRPIKDLLGLLHSADIHVVIDCRTSPKSRWPQYNQQRLSATLHDAGIKYEWRGSNIGGHAPNVYFNETLRELVKRAGNGEQIALLCSEGKPEDCHRSTFIAPVLEELGVHVDHLLYDSRKDVSI
jgi:uncharacterized protein (DUF488 family)